MQPEREACLAFLDLLGEWIDFGDGHGTHEKYGDRAAAGFRYLCVRGPGGLVRAVVR
jgi:hypothetical protein